MVIFIKVILLLKLFTTLCGVVVEVVSFIMNAHKMDQERQKKRVN